MTTAPRRPVLRYLGGKWRMAPWILEHMPPHRVYVEPYCGAASVLMRKPRSVAEIINDRSSDVVTLFRVLRDPVTAERLAESCALTPFARDEFEAAYEPSADPVEQSRRLLFRSFAGYHPGAATTATAKGMHTRTSTWVIAGQRRRGTTKASDWAAYPDAIAAFTARLQGVVIDNQDAGTVIAQHNDPDVLVYADPPYLHGTRQIDATGARYHHEMSDLEHSVLLAELIRSRSMVMLSAYAHPLYDDLLPSHRWVRLEREAITHDGTRRTEVLWLNQAAQVAREVAA